MTLPEGLEDGSRRRPAHLASVAPAPAATSANWGHVAWAPPQDRPEDAPRRIDVAAVWRIGVKHAGIIGLSLATALALGAAVTLLTRPIYSAKTTLQIDRQAEKVVSADEQAPLDNYSDEFFQTQYGLLRSRALLGRVAESQALTADDVFIETMTGRTHGQAGKPLTAEARRQRVIDLLRDHER